MLGAKEKCKGEEKPCPICGRCSKLFIPKMEHLCIEHGWFSTYSPSYRVKSKNELNKTEGEEVMSDNKDLCNFLTRDGTFCNVDITNRVCGYHKSDAQKKRDENLKESIAQVFYEVLTEDMEDLAERDKLSADIDHLLDSFSGKPAYELLYDCFHSLKDFNNE